MITTLSCLTILYSESLDFQETLIRETLQYMVSAPRESWERKDKMIEIVNIDGKTFARLGREKYIAEKKDDGAVFLYRDDGTLIYGASSDGKLWKM